MTTVFLLFFTLWPLLTLLCIALAARDFWRDMRDYWRDR